MEKGKGMNVADYFPTRADELLDTITAALHEIDEVTADAPVLPDWSALTWALEDRQGRVMDIACRLWGRPQLDC